MSILSKRILAGVFLLAALAIGIGIYLWFKPHRNVQSETVFARMTTSELIDEFTADPARSNAKYLSDDGNSKVLIIKGKVSKISTNQIGETVILLKDDLSRVGISATFTQQTNAHASGIKIGDIIGIKGAITAGNRYDKDLDLYENATLIQCDIAK